MSSGEGHRHDPEPDPVAVTRVRAELALLGSDARTAPDVPAEVTARVVDALRAAPPPRARRDRV